MNISRAMAGLKKKAVKRGASAAYSPAVRKITRSLVTSHRGAKLEKYIESKGLDGRVRRLVSETLPSGQYFAKLTIEDWEPHNGQPFRLMHGETVVFGNQIEPPARGFPLEYRNIVVTSQDPQDFSLNIAAKYSLQIGHGTFTTPQQVKYDSDYGIKQHGDVFYSIRGNLINPRRLIVTFPGFGPSTSRISYAVTYLKDITEADLSEALIVCFQDRYLVSGTYMISDSAGRPLYNRVNAVVSGLCEKYSLQSRDILFFGASKGGSIALNYAREYPDSHVLVAVPQVNLPYYMSKPFFRDNLYLRDEFHQTPQPEDLLRLYFSEGRKIDYFFTDDDELSNHSLVEFAHDVEGLTKFRVDGKHGEVAGAALPTMLNIIRRFIRNEKTSNPFDCDPVRTYEDDHSVGYQIRHARVEPQKPRINWYLTGMLGRTRYYQILSDHSLPFVKYTSPKQRVRIDLGPVGSFDGMTGFSDDGSRYAGSLPPVKTSRNFAEELPVIGGLAVHTEPLVLDGMVRSAFLLDDEKADAFRYTGWRSSQTGQDMLVQVVANLADVESPSEVVSTGPTLLWVESGETPIGLGKIILRFAVHSRAGALTISLQGEAASIDTVRVLSEIVWPDLKIEIWPDEDRATLAGDLENAFPAELRSEKIVFHKVPTQKVLEVEL